MAKLRAQTSASASSSPNLPAAELLSFLKENPGVQTWTERDLAKALKLGAAQSKEAIAVLQLQGYIEQAGRTEKWRTTEQGELVSGAKPRRFTRQSIEHALAALRDRIKTINADPDAAYKITEAVAFGDFLRDQPRAQAAEIGIRLAPKGAAQSTASAKQHAAEIAFLKELRGRTAVLHIQPYEDWMGARSHEPLI